MKLEFWNFDDKCLLVIHVCMSLKMEALCFPEMLVQYYTQESVLRFLKVVLEEDLIILTLIYSKWIDIRQPLKCFLFSATF
jgi:hypothetical protein